MYDLCSSSPSLRRRGLTLVEAVISIAIVGVMLVAALNTLGATVRARQLQGRWSQGAALAPQLMAEILQASYEEPQAGSFTLDDGEGGLLEIPTPLPPLTPQFGPEFGEDDGTRVNFNDVDDYEGWQGKPPQAKDGTPLDGYAEWQREVWVQFADPADAKGVGKSTETGLKRIEVNVTDPDGKVTTLVALKSKLGAYEEPPSAEKTFVAWVGVELQLGQVTAAMMSGSSLLNQLPIPEP